MLNYCNRKSQHCDPRDSFLDYRPTGSTGRLESSKPGDASRGRLQGILGMHQGSDGLIDRWQGPRCEWLRKQRQRGTSSDAQDEGAARPSTLKTLCNAKPKLVSRRMMRAKETGAWLNNLPNTLNDTVLAEEEFRDSLRLRFGLVDPLKLPSTCDGCGKKSTSTTPSSARREASSYTATTMSKRSGVRCVPAP